MARSNDGPRYPKQVVLTVSTEVDDTLTRIAEEQGLYRTEVARALIGDGLRRLGYHVATSDKRAPRVTDFKADANAEVKR